jgi:hypothetical protein
MSYFTGESWFTSFAGAVGDPERARRVAESLPTSLSGGHRKAIDRALTLASGMVAGSDNAPKRRAAWEDIATILRERQRAVDAPNALTGCYCATCRTDYTERGSFAAFGGPRYKLRQWDAVTPPPEGYNGPTVELDGVVYCPDPTSERGAPHVDDTRPLTLIVDGGIPRFNGYMPLRQNACLVCRPFKGEDRVALIASEGHAAYTERVAALWAERDAGAAKKHKPKGLTDAEWAAIVKMRVGGAS